MNCLTYLLDLWRQGQRFKIVYNGQHVIGINEYIIYDLENSFIENNSPYLPLEKCHSKETIIKIFDLVEKDIKTLKQYYKN